MNGLLELLYISLILSVKFIVFVINCHYQIWQSCSNFYRPHMREGNVFILSMCVCVSICVSVQAITFECLDKETSFWYGDTS